MDARTSQRVNAKRPRELHVPLGGVVTNVEVSVNSVCRKFSVNVSREAELLHGAKRIKRK